MGKLTPEQLKQLLILTNTSVGTYDDAPDTSSPYDSSSSSSTYDEPVSGSGTYDRYEDGGILTNGAIQDDKTPLSERDLTTTFQVGDKQYLSRNRFDRAAHEQDLRDAEQAKRDIEHAKRDAEHARRAAEAEKKMMANMKFNEGGVATKPEELLQMLRQVPQYSKGGIHAPKMPSAPKPAEAPKSPDMAKARALANLRKFADGGTVLSNPYTQPKVEPEQEGMTMDAQGLAGKVAAIKALKDQEQLAAYHPELMTKMSEQVRNIGQNKPIDDSLQVTQAPSKDLTKQELMNMVNNKRDFSMDSAESIGSVANKASQSLDRAAKLASLQDDMDKYSEALKDTNLSPEAYGKTRDDMMKVRSNLADVEAANTPEKQAKLAQLEQIKNRIATENLDLDTFRTLKQQADQLRFSILGEGQDADRTIIAQTAGRIK